MVHQQRLPELKDQVGRAAARAGRDISQITVAPQILCSAAAGAQELAEAEGRIRSHIAYYIGGMGSYYYDHFCRSGFRTEADAVREAWLGGQRDKAAAAISDELLDNMAIVGDAATCRSKLERFRRNGADMPIVAFPRGSPLASIQRTLEALAPTNVPTPNPAT